jgi:hypothetical protein
MTNGQDNRQGEQRRDQQGDTHAGQIQQDRGQQKQDLNPAEQNQGQQDSAQQGDDANRQQDQQDAILENNRGGADPTGGQVIREGGGPGENIAPRHDEDVEGDEDRGRLEQGQPGSLGQSAEEPAEGPRTEQELTRQNPD